MLPDVARITHALSGINIRISGNVLDLVRDVYAEGFYETFINEELQRRGYSLYFAPTAVVYHDKTYILKAAVAESYEYGRDFASRRLSGASPARRAAYVAASLVLPVLLIGRIVRRTLRKRRHFRELVACFPYLALLMSAWSYGELRGYLGKGLTARA